MPKSYYSVRLPTVNGEKVFIKTRSIKGAGGEYIDLYKVYISGRVREMPKAQILREQERAEELNKSDISGAEKRRRASEMRAKALNYNERQLINFLAKMPDVISGMLKIKDKLPSQTRERLETIVDLLRDLSLQERNQFYIENRDLFEDSTDWYLLMKKYGFKPSVVFELDMKDLIKMGNKLGLKGFKNYDLNSLTQRQFNNLKKRANKIFEDYQKQMDKSLDKIIIKLQEYRED